MLFIISCIVPPSFSLSQFVAAGVVYLLVVRLLRPVSSNVAAFFVVAVRVVISTMFVRLASLLGRRARALGGIVSQCSRGSSQGGVICSNVADGRRRRPWRR